MSIYSKIAYSAYKFSIVTISDSWYANTCSNIQIKDQGFITPYNSINKFRNSLFTKSYKSYLSKLVTDVR